MFLIEFRIYFFFFFGSDIMFTDFYQKKKIYIIPARQISNYATVYGRNNITCLKFIIIIIINMIVLVCFSVNGFLGDVILTVDAYIFCTFPGKRERVLCFYYYYYYILYDERRCVHTRGSLHGYRVRVYTVPILQQYYCQYRTIRKEKNGSQSVTRV